jgi:hypothetical protein
MNTTTAQTVSDQPPNAHRLPTGWSVRSPANERRVPSNLTACDRLAQLLLERLTVGIDLSPECVALVDALVDFLVPDELDGVC